MSDAWVGVVGTALGAVLGAAATLLVQYLTMKQENAHRFTADRRKLYADLLYDCDQISVRFQEIASSGPFPPELSVSAHAVEGANRANDAIFLTASKGVAAAANAMVVAMATLSVATADLQGPVDGPGPQGPWVTPWLSCREALTTARAEFVRQARLEIEVDTR